VPKTLYDPTIAWENNYNPYIARKGETTFNGQKALLYAKSRETSSDFDRGQRQRLVLVALKDKALSPGTLANPAKISSLMSSLGSNIYTDFNFNEILKLKSIMQQIPSDQIKSLDLVTPPNDFLTTGNIGGLSVVEPKAGLFNYNDIIDFIRGSFRDGYLAKENASVAVYNATDSAGLGAKKAKLLKSYGYNVTTVENTNLAGNSNTILVDLSKGMNKYTRHYLELRYGQAARTNLPPGSNIHPPQGTDFVIILGTDAESSQ